MPKVSLFSHLNNLADITMNKNYATLAGYTQAEVEHYFEDYIQLIVEDLQISREDLLEKMKIWYNGYSWDGVTRVYNPFGTLNFLSNRDFRNYWFSTGSPKFLIEQMRERILYNIENSYIDGVDLEKFDLEHIQLTSLLFQTGYLTIKERQTATGGYILNYPNKEVQESMYQFLIADLAQNPQRTGSGRTINDLCDAFMKRDLTQIRLILNSILADLPSNVYQKQTEGLYHGLVHIIFSYLGMFVQSEVHSAQGRADAVVETATDIFILNSNLTKRLPKP
ncbi:MAG: AAA family ATPase [Saprospiraceae bacterium]|nr:AAA family ATPase [Saprospiraceae bacterium]